MELNDIDYDDKGRWAVSSSKYDYAVCIAWTEMPANYVYKILSKIPDKHAKTFIEYERRQNKDKCVFKFIHDNKLEEKNILEIITLHKLYYS